jgi:pentatricopeptide repeat protein
MFSDLIKSFIPQKSLSLGRLLHSLIITSGFSSHKYCNILINGYVQSGDLESAQRLFNEMLERNVAT